MIRISLQTREGPNAALQRSNMDLKYQLSELVSMDNLTFDPRKENHPSQRSIFSEILCLLFTQLTNFLEAVFQCVFMLGCTAKNGQTEEEKVEKGGKELMLSYEEDQGIPSTAHYNGLKLEVANNHQSNT